MSAALSNLKSSLGIQHFFDMFLFFHSVPSKICAGQEYNRGNWSHSCRRDASILLLKTRHRPGLDNISDDQGLWLIYQGCR